MPSNHLILCRPLPLPPSIFPSIRVFSSDSVLRIRWAKYWSFSFSLSPSNEYSGLISFRMDWLDLLAVQGVQESSPAPQFKASVHEYSYLLVGQGWPLCVCAVALSPRMKSGSFCSPWLKKVHTLCSHTVSKPGCVVSSASDCRYGISGMFLAVNTRPSPGTEGLCVRRPSQEKPGSVSSRKDMPEATDGTNQC